MPDMNGVLSSVFDSANNALRISAINDSLILPPGEFSGTFTTVVTNDVPRIQFPDAATTSAYTTFFAPATWSQCDIGLIWTGTAASANPMRWRVAVKKTDWFFDNISEAFFADVSANIAPSVTPGLVIASPGHIDNMNVVPGGIGSSYTLMVQRIGGDAGDTNTGIGELLGVLLARA